MDSDTTRWKIISYDENGEPLLRYDEHHDEIINVQTGEVIQGH